VAIIEDVLRMHAGILASAKVKVDRNYGRLPQVPMNKVKLMQVLMNIVKNGVESIIQQGPQDGRMAIRASADAGEVILEISDNGVGIEPQTLKRLFNHGFTTKPKGHGFGLHYCANALAEMGGRIEVRSEGVGKGANFVLHMPVAAKEVAA
jgi:C4-dicarboxylate-specific signal transduction histidine kinase